MTPFLSVPEGASSPAERRQAPRARLRLTVDVCEAGQGLDLTTTRLIDLSETGACIEYLRRCVEGAVARARGVFTHGLPSRRRVRGE